MPDTTSSDTARSDITSAPANHLTWQQVAIGKADRQQRHGHASFVIWFTGLSGSGKSTLANLVLGFIQITSGQILFKGTDVALMNKAQQMEYRREVQAIFQDPYAVYNPFYRVKHIFDLVVNNFKLANSKSEARELVEDALNVVGLRGEEVLEKYP
ncbi:MAG: ATP-binding cassette domain-containing protein, partial [Cyanobacteria bacterium HKST-UBA05]|nr:ATP-binding cassette domain-containing protein [Cyanobacteria bacterium HKST-UBA05]